jgi:hypothetical protein
MMNINEFWKLSMDVGPTKQLILVDESCEILLYAFSLRHCWPMLFFFFFESIYVRLEAQNLM